MSGGGDGSVLLWKSNLDQLETDFVDPETLGPSGIHVTNVDGQSVYD